MHSIVRLGCPGLPALLVLLLGCGAQPSWEVALDGEASAPVLTRDGKVVLVTSSPSLQAFDAEGLRVWNVPLEAVAYPEERPAFDGPFGPIVLPTGGIVAPAGSQVLTSFSERGEQQWRAELPCKLSSSLAALSDGAIVVPCSNATLLVLDPADGHTRWIYREGSVSSGISWAPAPAVTRDDAIVAGLGFTQILHLDAGGTLAWSHRVSGATAALALGPGGGIVYATSNIGSAGGQLRGLVTLSSEGTVRGFSELPEGSSYEPTTADDEAIHVASHAAFGGPKLLRYRPGADREEVTLPAEPLSGVLLAEGGVRIVRTSGDRLLVFRERGTDEYPLPDWRTPPLLTAEGVLYATSRSTLHRLNLDVPQAAGSVWARPRGDNQASGRARASAGAAPAH